MQTTSGLRHAGGLRSNGWSWVTTTSMRFASPLSLAIQGRWMLDAKRQQGSQYPTSINPVRDLTMRTTGGDPDVWVYYDDYGANGVAGWVDCPSSSQTGGPQARGWCRFSQARYNEHYVSGDSQARARSRACHELGHTIGLRHPSDENDPDTFASCMSTPTSASKIGITVHDTNHLNNHY